MDNVGKKLRKIFDYQKFEKEPKLQGVIEGSTHRQKMSDDELELVAGGVMTGDDSEDPQSYGRCPVAHCGNYLKKTPYGYICTGGHHLDVNKNLIDNQFLKG